jgi:hypothetical protein
MPARYIGRIFIEAPPEGLIYFVQAYWMRISGSGFFSDLHPSDPTANIIFPGWRYPEHVLTRRIAAASVAMFLAPFLLLGCCYGALAPELTVLRNPMAGAVLVASKSPFTVFRVPLMNVAHGMMCAVMLSHRGDFKDAQRRAAYCRIFLTLLFAIAVKSDFEALEASAQACPLGPLVPWLTRGTVLSVVAGLGIASLHARRVPLPWAELRLSKLDKVALGFLLVAYLAIGIASLLVSHWG